MKYYEAGETFTTKDGYEFLAKGDRGKGCDLCIGQIHEDVCDMLPGCGGGDGGIAWVPVNDLAKTLRVVMKLEGNI